MLNIRVEEEYLYSPFFFVLLGPVLKKYRNDDRLLF